MLDRRARQRHSARSLLVAVGLLATAVSASRPVRADEPAPGGARSTTVAYVLGVGLTVAPMYATMAMAKANPGSEYSIGGRALIMAGLCLGPSGAYAYARSWDYAAASGAIKTGLVAAALYADHRKDPRGSEFGLALFAVSGVALWDAADLLWLRRTVMENNERERQGRDLLVAPFFIGQADAITGGGLSLASRF
jgi:hypothetical protein